MLTFFVTPSHEGPIFSNLIFDYPSSCRPGFDCRHLRSELSLSTFITVIVPTQRLIKYVCVCVIQLYTLPGQYIASLPNPARIGLHAIRG